MTAVVLGLAVARCGGGPAPSSSAAGRPASTPARSAVVGPAGSTPLAVDARLLATLPAQIAGAELIPTPDTATGMITDPALGQSASGIAVGMFVAPGDSGKDDLAISTVVQLRPGVNGDAFYEAWRAAYDRSACEPAGGIASHASQLIGPHAVEVTLCGGGARLYHTRLRGDRLVSITAVGARKFGDLVIAGLRE